MTLRELAEKKTRTAESPAPRLGFVIRSQDQVQVPENRSRSRAAGSAPEPVPPAPSDRLLGTENLADVIPMFPPRGPGPEQEWEQASLLPAGSLGMILDGTTRTAWLASSRPGMPPLLICPFPILGRLSKVALDPVLEVPSPFATSHGENPDATSPHASQPASAPRAG
jgi:hypothetical protein